MKLVGIGMRQPHYRDLLEQQPPLGFVEVHSENFFAAGGASRAVLREARQVYDVSLHGVGLSLGSASGLDLWHLDQLAALVQDIDPVRVSDHASFARAPLGPGGPLVHAADLLPLAYTPASLAVLCANVQQVQERLRRPMLVENLSAYLSFADDSLAEPDYFAQLCRRTGCQLLLDLNNLYVNAQNRREADPLAACLSWVRALPAGCVGEIHLAGCTRPDEPDTLVIDDHATRVHEPVWQLYDHALEHLGPVATLIEWDTNLPALDVLLDEARRVGTAHAVEARQSGVGGAHPTQG